MVAWKNYEFCLFWVFAWSTTCLPGGRLEATFRERRLVPRGHGWQGSRHVPRRAHVFSWRWGLARYSLYFLSLFTRIRPISMVSPCFYVCLLFFIMSFSPAVSRACRSLHTPVAWGAARGASARSRRRGGQVENACDAPFKGINRDQ